MKKVLVIDPNISFAKQIANQIKLLEGDLYDFHIQEDSTNIRCDFDLLIVHESFLCQMNSTHQEKVLVLYESAKACGNCDKENIFRGDKLPVWVEKISNYFLYQIGENEKQTQNRRLLIYYSFFEQHPSDFDQILRQQKEAGKEIFILPLKPLYQWNYEANFHQGVTLSDYYLQLETGIEPKIKEFGHLFEKQKAGYFLPRPSKYCDDILNCERQVIDSLVKIFRDFLEYISPESLGIIDACALPFSRVKNIAFECDAIFLRVPVEKTFGDRKSKELIADLLAEKPANLAFSPWYG